MRPVHGSFDGSDAAWPVIQITVYRARTMTKNGDPTKPKRRLMIIARDALSPFYRGRRGT